VGGGFEVGIAFAAAAPAGDDEGLSRGRQILDDFTGSGIPHQGSGRDFNKKIASALTCSLAPLTGGAAFGSEFALETEGIQRSAARRTHQDHVAPFSAVASVRPPTRHVFFPAKTHTTVSAVAGLNGYDRFVNKFHSDA
jgi:hypothetical protein